MVVWFLTACTAGAEPAPCPGWSDPSEAGRVARGDLSEASGLVRGRLHPDVLWSHNDRGGGVVLYALGVDGSDRGSVALTGATHTDWEDIAAGPGPDGDPWIYVGDIGDNKSERDSITIWRLPEPSVVDVDGASGDVQPLTLRYPDGAHDAETLLFDPATHDLFVLTKSRTGASGVYRADAHVSGVIIELEKVGEVVLGDEGLGGDARLTGGDIGPSGDRILLRSRNRVFVWERSAGSTVAETLADEPCAGPRPSEPQGEALAASDGGYWTLSEGAAAPLYRVEAP